MTYTLPRYQSYQEYLDDDQLHPEGNYRLLSTGEVIEVSSEDDRNLWLANLVMAAILKVQGLSFIKFIRNGNKELQVAPIGDKWVNRKPDILLLRPEHFGEVRQAIKFGAPAPLFVAEIVSPGGELSDNYLRAEGVTQRLQGKKDGFHRLLTLQIIFNFTAIEPHQTLHLLLTIGPERYPSMS